MIYITHMNHATVVRREGGGRDSALRDSSVSPAV